MMLNSMQLLPVADISRIALLDNRIADSGNNQRRKAADEGRSNAHQKKAYEKARPTNGDKVATRSCTRATTAKEDVTMGDVA